MSGEIDELLGHKVQLAVRRFGPPGAFLALDDDPDGFCLLLPRAEVPEGLQEGDTASVFVYLDSSNRPIATTIEPALELHEVAFLRVADLTKFGAFVNWGLPKELLVPFAEQTSDLKRGDRHPIGLIRDRSGRLAGTMRIRELMQEGGDFEVDEWVAGEAWREEPGLGVFVIVERRFVGLLPEREPHPLKRGEAASFRVARVLEDGRIELSLRGLAHEELSADAERVLSALSAERAPRVSDKSSPEQIRAHFGLSKKAFKRAVGRLLKQGLVALDAQGNVTPRA